MSNWLEQLTSEHVRDLSPYESARRLFAASQGQERVWLNANESPEAGEYLLSCELLNRYPDCQPQAVLESYAKYSGVLTDNILITRGADEGIELLIRAFCQGSSVSNNKVLICPPTYGMYAISANTFNVEVEKVLLKPDFSVDVEKVNDQAGKVKLVFLCSPNNPTGSIIAQADIEAIIQAHSKQAIVVLDEAYIEFSSTCAQQSLLQKYPNLVILRTLSKAFALAGIRCGFVLCSAEIKHILLKVIAPYPVPDPVAQIATQALSEQGLTIMQTRVQNLNKQLSLLSDSLAAIPGIELVGSQCGNFVLFRSPYNKTLMLFLVANNMLIRDQSKQVMLDNCLRISVGTKEQNELVLLLIHSFFSQQLYNILPNQEAVS